MQAGDYYAQPGRPFALKFFAHETCTPHSPYDILGTIKYILARHF